MMIRAHLVCWLCRRWYDLTLSVYDDSQLGQPRFWCRCCTSEPRTFARLLRQRMGQADADQFLKGLKPVSETGQMRPVQRMGRANVRQMDVVGEDHGEDMDVHKMDNVLDAYELATVRSVLGDDAEDEEIAA
jgi:hypothetical protein